MKKKKISKGEFGYIRNQKKVRLLKTVLMFACAFAIFLVGFVLNNGDKKNIYTVIACLGIIPASLSLIEGIMMWMRTPMDESLYRRISEVSGDLVMAYEMYFTTHDINLFVDAAAIANDTVAAFTHEDAKPDVIHFMEDHIQKSLRASGHRRTVKIFQNEKQFLERVSQLAGKSGPTEEDRATRHSMLTIVL